MCANFHKNSETFKETKQKMFTGICFYILDALKTS